MKYIAIAIPILFAGTILAQQASLPLPAACGPANIRYAVNIGATPPSPAHPEPGKALVYFIQDDGIIGNHQHYTVRIGSDGAWVGAYKANSYFTASVGPGEHHICANVQSDSEWGEIVALAHLTAEPGKIYYFRTRFIAGMTSLYPVPPFLNLDQPDSDEAEHLIATYPAAISHRKK